MPNMLMMRYAGSRGNENRNEMRGNENRGENRNEMRQGGNRNEMAYSMGGEMRGGNRNEMMGDMEGGMRNEMRGGNQNAYNRGMDYDTENRNEYGGAESRYRGRDGRWKSGRRRSEYEGEDREMRRYETRRAGGDDDDEEDDSQEYKVKVSPSSNVIEWPYATPLEDRARRDRNGRQIGFGATNAMEGYETEENHRSGMHEMHDYEEGGRGEGFGREKAEKWVRNMEAEDPKQPKGGKWTPEMIRPIAQKYGINPESERFWEFYAVMNAIYSDTSMIAKEYGITTPDYYAKLAKAWLEDRDAVPNKAEMYYKYIVKHH